MAMRHALTGTKLGRHEKEVLRRRISQSGRAVEDDDAKNTLKKYISYTENSHCLQILK